jgi:hypothetical protein
MKKFIAILCMSLIVTGTYSQKGNYANVKSKKEFRKEQLKAEKETQALSVEKMVSDQQFYFDVTSMSGQYRAYSQSAGTIEMSSQRNYIAIDSNKLLMQLAPNTISNTNWGKEILPVRGSLLQYQFTKSDTGFLIHSFTTGEVGESEFTINVSPMGSAVLRILKVNGGTLVLRGTLMPLDQTRISASLF